MNIVIVGLDDEFVTEFAKNVASALNYKSIDFDSIFEEVLRENFKVSIFDENEILESKEKHLIANILTKDRQVISISNNAFLSCSNYLLLKNAVTICIEKIENEKILKNVQKLIKKHCKINIKQEKIDFNKLKNHIFKYINLN